MAGFVELAKVKGGHGTKDSGQVKGVMCLAGLRYPRLWPSNVFQCLLRVCLKGVTCHGVISCCRSGSLCHLWISVVAGVVLGVSKGNGRGE